MTSQKTNPSYGLPAPITELTMEQDLKMRVIEDKINESYDEHKKEIITLFLALQKQNFVLGNSLKNLITHWPNEEIIFIGTSKGVPI